MKTVVALYDHLSDANATVRDLVDYGLGRDQISLMAADANGNYSSYLAGTTAGAATAEAIESTASGAATGAGIGAIVGGLGGLLIGLGVLVIPGIGPVLAAGPLATGISALTGAGVGAMAGGAAGGLLGALVDLGLPEETAGNYAEGIRRGGTLVTARTEDHQAEDVRRIMNRHNVINIDDRARGWRNEGWAGYREDVAEAQSVSAVGSDLSAHDAIAQPPQGIATGGEPYREPQRINEPQGIATGGEPYREPQRTDEPQGIATGGEPFREPQRIDQPQGMAGGGEGVLETGYGDSGIGNVSTSGYGVSGVGSFTAPGGAYSGSSLYDADERFGRYNTYFEEHYNTNYANRGHDYQFYRPAYYYGYQLANEDRFHDWTWDDIEPEARREWGLRSDVQGTWEDFKDTVHDAWVRVREGIEDALD